MMMSVCDEADYIVDHLLYHRFLGVTRAYVFLDHCTDNTRELLRAIPWVVPIECNRDTQLGHLTQHQNLCASIALELARKEHFDWLLHIDPDEYAWGESSSSGETGGSLVEMLRNVDPGTELVWLRPKEAVPVQGNQSEKLWAQQYFQEQPNVLKRPMLDPITGQVEQLNKWIGHVLGKSIVRVSADAIPVSAHFWGSAHSSGNRELTREDLGFHYHFVAANARHWHQKYLKLSWEADKWEQGITVPFPKQAWKDASMRLSADAAKGYFEEWVAIHPDQADSLVQQGRLSHEKNVARTMAQTSRDPVIAIENWLGRQGIPLTLSRHPWRRLLKKDQICTP